MSDISTIDFGDDPVGPAATPVQKAALLAELLGQTRLAEALVSITGLTGGAATALDSVATTGLEVGAVVVLPRIVIGASVVSRWWVLETSASRPAESSQVVHPDDDSNKYWQAF